MRSDQDRIDVKSDVNGREVMVSIRRLGKKISDIFRRQGKIQWMILKGGKPIEGVNLRLGLTSYPQFETGGVKVRPMSGESIL